MKIEVAIEYLKKYLEGDLEGILQNHISESIQIVLQELELKNKIIDKTIELIEKEEEWYTNKAYKNNQEFFISEINRLQNLLDKKDDKIKYLEDKEKTHDEVRDKLTNMIKELEEADE